MDIFLNIPNKELIKNVEKGEIPGFKIRGKRLYINGDLKLTMTSVKGRLVGIIAVAIPIPDEKATKTKDLIFNPEYWLSADETLTLGAIKIHFPIKS